MIYLYFYILLLLLISASNLLKKHIKDYAFLSFVLIGSFYSGSRFYTGGDYENYKEVYLHNLDLFGYTEPGYLLLNWLVINLGFSYESYLIIANILINTLLFIALRRLSPSYLISLIVYVGIYYLQHQFNWIRQGIASVVVLNALFYFKNSTKKYLLLTVLASLFHTAAVLAIFLPYMFKSIKYRYYVPIVFISIIIFNSNLVILSVFDLLEAMTNNFLVGKLRYYLIENTDYANVLNIYSLSSIKRVVLLLFLVVFSEILSQRYRFFHEISLFYFLSMIIYYVFQFNEVVAARASQIFQFVDLIIFVMPFLIIKSLHMKFLYFCILMSYLIYTFMATVATIEANFLPYKSFLF